MFSSSVGFSSYVPAGQSLVVPRCACSRAMLAHGDEMLDDILTVEEVERAVLSLKNGKSGGIDGLTRAACVGGRPQLYRYSHSHRHSQIVGETTIHM